MTECWVEGRLNFATWEEGMRRVCKELLAKTQPYHVGDHRTNSIQQQSLGGVWVRRIWTPWTIRDIVYKCVLCYRFNTRGSAGWSWCGCAEHLFGTSLVCLDCKTSWPKQEHSYE
jgi:hypothetical protein